MSNLYHEENHSVITLSTTFKNIMGSLASKSPLEVAEDLNGLALMQHFMFNNPLEALQLHLFAIDLEIEGTKRLDIDAENNDDKILAEEKKTIASAIIITLTDIGNCFWSSQSKMSRIAYESARSIYKLMDINRPVLSMSLTNRLGKLAPLSFVDNLESNSDRNINCPDSICISEHAFERSIDITKSIVERLHTALLDEVQRI